MKTFVPINDGPIVGHLELIAAHLAILPADFDGLRLLIHEGVTSIGRRGYIDGKEALGGFLETIQLFNIRKDGVTKVVDAASENGTVLVRARSAEDYIHARAAHAHAEGMIRYPERVMPELVEHSEDVLFLGRTHAHHEPPHRTLQSGDLIDHLYATWRVTLL